MTTQAKPCSPLAVSAPCNLNELTAELATEKSPGGHPRHATH